MSGVRWARVAHAFRRVALPLASYYAVTLALPLANGAAPSGAFLEHALVVLVVPPIAIILGCAVHTIAHALARLWNTTSWRVHDRGRVYSLLNLIPSLRRRWRPSHNSPPPTNTSVAGSGVGFEGSTPVSVALPE